MWEAIRSNKRRSVLLIAGLGTMLILLGYVMGSAIHPQAGLIGCGVAFFIWLVLFLISVLGGRGVLLGSVRAREIQHADSPRLFNIVEEMTIAAGLPKLPKVYIIDTDAPNAFAVGTEDNSAVAVTSGLMIKLNRDELQGVIAHEIGHITNHDTRFMTIAGVMVAAIVILADMFVRGVFYSAVAGRRRSRGRGGGQAQIVIFLIAIVFAILAPLLAQMLYFACSRRREYLADACSARYTRYPAGLARALQKISGSADDMKNVSRAVAPMFIINPRMAVGGSGLLSTHPATEDRVEILLSMGGGAGYAEYEAAFRRSHGDQGVLGARTLAESDSVGLREPSAEPEKDDLARARDTVDILHRLNGFLMLGCVCGLKIKVPPGFKKNEIKCPSCSRVHPIPMAAMVAAAAALGDELEGKPDEAAAPAAAPLTFKYTPGRWNSFRCTCDTTVQLSPSFRANKVRCPDCKREIKVTR